MCKINLAVTWPGQGLDINSHFSGTDNMMAGCLTLIILMMYILMRVGLTLIGFWSFPERRSVLESVSTAMSSLVVLGLVLV